MVCWSADCRPDFNFPLPGNLGAIIPIKTFAPNKLVNVVPCNRFPDPFLPAAVGSLTLDVSQIHGVVPYS